MIVVKVVLPFYLERKLLNPSPVEKKKLNYLWIFILGPDYNARQE
jgi:hypothetical protein